MSSTAPPSTSSSPQCQIILTLAHLLQQHSVSYDDEKNLILNASVKCAMAMSANNSNASGGEGEVHMVLTGSPRPTFAETNAWLLPPTTPKKKKNNDDNNNNMDTSMVSNAGSLRG